MTLNAFLQRAPAPAPDDEPADGPLAGLSVGVKANIAVAGMPFHAGIGAWRERVAERDAAVVVALRTAGARIAGVLNMEEAALGAKTDNPAFGATQNPHRAGHSPGGSSGGSGAAVAAGLCDAALGTDTMGSIRIPAAHCGIYGFKPAPGRVSQDGLEPAYPPFDAIGPLARDVATLKRVARIVSDVGEGELRGEGVTLDGHGVELHPATAAAWDRALSALGVTAREPLPDPCSRVRFAGFVTVSRWLAERLEGVPVSDRLAALLAYGPGRSQADAAEDEAVLARARNAVRHAVDRHGFVLLPAVPNPPFPHSEREPPAQADFTCLANVAGLPALALPAGWTDDCLPVGVQLVAAAGREAGLFALARRLDAALGAYRPPEGEFA